MAEAPADDVASETDADNEKGPLRRCLASGRTRPKEDLLRFAVSPDGEVVFDAEGRLPGRGLWLSLGRDVVNTALAKGLFAKAARRKVNAPADLADRIEAQLKRRCLDLLGFARRSGAAVSGFEKVLAEAKAARVALLLEAKDGADGGRDKVLQAMRATQRSTQVAALFSAEDLGQPFGRDRAVHVAIAPGVMAERLAEEIDRLMRYQGASGPDEDGRKAAKGRADDDKM